MALLLENALAAPTRNRLVNSLNTNDRWNHIIEGLRTYRIPVVLDVSCMHQMGRRKSPADWLLEELFDRLCSFDEFCNMLREFDLLEELALLTPAEPMVIEVHPGNGERDVRIENGEELQLTCRASGLPRPSYQWYHDNTLLPDHTGPTLSINPFTVDKRGEYCCRVRQEIRGHVTERMSAEVMVDLLAVKPQLLVDLPRLRSLLRGQTLELTVSVEGYPEPSYEWFRSTPDLTGDSDDDEEVMPNIVLCETSNTLQVKNTGLEMKVSTAVECTTRLGRRSAAPVASP